MFSISKESSIIFSKIFLPLYFWILFLIGLSFSVTLYPFSGFDEPAHYSSIRQIADTGKIPVYGKDLIDRTALELQTPYIHPLDQNQLNYEAQHPPLYYMVLAPLEKMIEGVPIENQLQLLRIASLVIALVGVVFGFLAARKSSKLPYENSTTIGFVLYPLIFCGFLPEFARIGNDSLCIFFTGLSAFFLSQSLQKETSRKLSLATGVTLGAGLLTKAFFIPILAALVGFLLVRIISGKKELDNETYRNRGRNILFIMIPAFFIGGGWYLYKFLVYGDFIGANDSIELAQGGGFLSGFEAHFTLQSFWKGLWIFLRSYLFYETNWLNTDIPPMILFIPTISVLLLCLTGFVTQLWHRPAQDSSWLSVWLCCAMGVGFLYHIFVGIALNGIAQTPGWYLHILMPWTAPALGNGVCTLLHIPRVKPFALVVLTVCGFFIPVARLVASFLELATLFSFMWVIGIGGIFIGGLLVARAYQKERSTPIKV